MTEKRFEIDNESDIVEFDWDTNEYVQEFRWGDGKSWDRICNRLNELYEENEQLKEDYNDVVSTLFKANEESEQLKQELQNKDIKYLRKCAMVLLKYCEDLEKELQE